jgi:hypothetical protein
MVLPILDAPEHTQTTAKDVRMAYYPLYLAQNQVD